MGDQRTYGPATPKGQRKKTSGNEDTLPSGKVESVRPKTFDESILNSNIVEGVQSLGPHERMGSTKGILVGVEEINVDSIYEEEISEEFNRLTSPCTVGRLPDWGHGRQKSWSDFNERILTL